VISAHSYSEAHNDSEILEIVGYLFALITTLLEILETASNTFKEDLELE